MARDIQKVGVVGLGTMGAGVAEVCARHGFPVVGVDLNEKAVARGRDLLAASTARAVSGDKMDEADQTALLERIAFTGELEDLADCDLVIECVPEDHAIKHEVFARLDEVVGDAAIIATNTSSLSITDLAATTKHPNRVLGMHFFNPAPVLRLVEVVGTVITAADVIEDVKAFVERIDRLPVVVGDKAGFIANALLLGYLNHAVLMYENQYATREDLDAAMRYGCNYPMGPLALIDLIGLDVCFAVLDTMYREGRDRLHAPSPLLKQMVAAGRLGRKSGRGFYTYDKSGSSTVVPDELTPAPVGEGSDAVRPIRAVGVVGSGTMAQGIVEVFATSGYDVVVVARRQEKANGTRAAVDRSIEKAVQRGRATEEDRAAAVDRITASSRLEDLGDVDLVVEAIAEDLTIKQAMFENLDEICKPGAILSTTTSSLPVIQCARVTSRPQDVIGLHFFNPANRMKLVEIVTTVATGADVVQTSRDLCAKVGKHPVLCSDRAGFIVNALLFPYLNDAIKMLEAHYATADEIDIAMKVGGGLPMGPFELLDVVGLDVAHAIQRELYLEFRERGYAPAPLLEHLVTAGYLGRKSGRGFRAYT